MVVSVTGASGQLGQALRSIADDYPGIRFVFADSSEANLTNPAQLHGFFEATKPDFCINAAAYTAVDKAESEPEKAKAVNVDGVAHLAKICKELHCTLIHISTDFVFDGSASRPYRENEATHPTGVYGRTKRAGELEVLHNADRYFIVRTSWVYSEFGNNFMKTMLRLATERDVVNVVDDQIGTPTYAVDLARALVAISQSGSQDYGIYHYSNEGKTSWFGFAREIFSLSGSHVKLNPIPTTAFPTPAKRPAYSVLDKAAVKKTFGLEIRDWKDALAAALAANS